MNSQQHMYGNVEFNHTADLEATIRELEATIRSLQATILDLQDEINDLTQEVDTVQEETWQAGYDEGVETGYQSGLSDSYCETCDE